MIEYIHSASLCNYILSVKRNDGGLIKTDSMVRVIRRFACHYTVMFLKLK